MSMINRFAPAGRSFLHFFIWAVFICALPSCDDDDNDGDDDDGQTEEQAMIMPENARVLFENDYVNVMTIRLLPGEELPDLGTDDYVLYHAMSIEEMYAGDTTQTDSVRENMKDYTAPNYAAQTGQDTTMSMKWSSGKMYTASDFRGNDTGMEANYLVISKSNRAMNSSADRSMDADVDDGEAEMVDSATSQTDGDMDDHDGKVTMYKNLGTAGGFTLEEIYIPTGDTLKRKETAPRALFYITSHTYNYGSPEQSRRNVSNERGQMKWLETTREYIINTGPTPVRMLIIKPDGAERTMN